MTKTFKYFVVMHILFFCLQACNKKNTQANTAPEAATQPMPPAPISVTSMVEQILNTPTQCFQVGCGYGSVNGQSDNTVYYINNKGALKWVAMQQIVNGSSAISFLNSVNLISINY